MSKTITKQKQKKVEEEEEGEVIRTWGSGTGKTTMVLHVRKQDYMKLGWKIGDLVYMIPDYDKGILTVKRVDRNKL